MKKCISLLLAFALILCMGTTVVFAAGGSEEGVGQEEREIGVNAKYVDGASSADVYSIDLSWGAMEFTYTTSGTNVWNPETHEYTTTSTSEWTSNGNTITVTNHSNKEVTAIFEYESDTAYSTVTGTFSVDSIDLPSAVDKAVDAAELTGEVTFTIGGTLDSTVTDFTKVGTITVTLS